MKEKARRGFTTYFKGLTHAEWVLLIVLAAELVYYVYCNLIHMTDSIESDLAKMMVHTIEMARNHSFLIRDWNYTTTAEWDSVALPAVIPYLLTHNISLSYALINVINICLWVFLISRLLFIVGMERVYRLLVLALVFGHFDMDEIWYTSDMLFAAGAQYTYKVMLPLWFLVILYAAQDRRRSITNLILIVLFCIMMVITGASSGVYVLLCGLLPILLCVAVFFLMGRDKPDRYTVFLCVAAIGCITLGIMAGRRLDVNPGSSEAMDLWMLSEAEAAPFKNLFALLNVWSIFPVRNVSAMSADGIVMIVKYVLVCVMLVLGLKELNRLFGIRRLWQSQDAGDVSERVRACLITIFAWNYLVLQLTTTSARYQLIGAIPLMLCAVFALRDMVMFGAEPRRRKWIENAVMLVTALCLTLILWRGIHYSETAYYPRTRGTVAFSDALTSYLDTTDCKTVMILDKRELCEILRLYDEDRRYSCLIVPEGGEPWFFNWDYYSAMDDYGLFAENSIVVGTEEAVMRLAPELLRDRVYQGTYHLDTHFQTADYQVWIPR